MVRLLRTGDQLARWAVGAACGPQGQRSARTASRVPAGLGALRGMAQWCRPARRQQAGSVDSLSWPLVRAGAARVRPRTARSTRLRSFCTSDGLSVPGGMGACLRRFWARIGQDGAVVGGPPVPTLRARSGGVVGRLVHQEGVDSGVESGGGGGALLLEFGNVGAEGGEGVFLGVEFGGAAASEGAFVGGALEGGEVARTRVWSLTRVSMAACLA